MLGSIVHLHSYLNETFGKQTVSVSGNPIRWRVLQRLIWVCTVCLCSTKKTLGLYGLMCSWGLPGGSLCSLKIMHWSTKILEKNFISSLKVFCLASQIPKINSASPKLPQNISQFSLKCIFLSVGLKSHTLKLWRNTQVHDLMFT